jgi:glycerol-3-phosphate dehydrogenase
LYQKIGSLVVAFTPEDRKMLETLLDRGNKNHVPGLRIVEQDELDRMEPNISPDAIAALYAPSAGIVMPWELAIAQAECAVQGGAEVRLETKVTGITKEKDSFKLTVTGSGAKNGEETIEATYVVNASGVECAAISSMVENTVWRVNPKRGEYYLLDTTEGGLVRHTIFPCPSDKGKGVLVSPTVHGNIIVGPDSTPCAADATENTQMGLDYVRANAGHLVPKVNLRASIRNFAGVRADAGGDFIVGESDKVPGFYNMAGIKSPGLSSAPAIARAVAGMINLHLDADENPDFVATRRVVRFKEASAMEKAARNSAARPVMAQCAEALSELALKVYQDTLHEAPETER